MSFALITETGLDIGIIRFTAFSLRILEFIFYGDKSRSMQFRNGKTINFSWLISLETFYEFELCKSGQ